MNCCAQEEQAAIAYKLLVRNGLRAVRAEIEVPGPHYGRFFAGRMPNERDGNVQNIAMSPASCASSPVWQRTAVLANPFAFFLFSRVLSRGGWFNISKDVSAGWQGAENWGF